MMRERRTERRAVAIGAALLAPILFGGGCYTRVVEARGLGADSTELREAAERDPRPGDRRIKRRMLFPEPGDPSGSE